MDGTRLKHVSEFKYLGFILDESGTDGADGRKVVGAIRSQVNDMGLRHECARVLHDSFLVSVILCDCETMIRREKEKSRIRAVQMNNLRGLLDIRKMDILQNARIRVE